MIDEFKKVWADNTKKETSEHFGISFSAVDKLVRENNLFKRKIDLPSKLNKKQHELVIGSLLGDGSLSKPRKNKSNFVESHSVVQKEYLSWKNDILKPFSRHLVSSDSVDNVVFPKGKIGNRKQSFQCYTLFHNLFYEMEKDWYLRDDNGEHILRSGRRVKCLPPELEITPFIFSVWFFDDGRNNQSQRNAAISSDGFSKDECDRLVEIVERGIGIVTEVRKTRCDHQYEIYIPARSYFDCMDLIKDQGIKCECMKYKSDTSSCVVKQPRLSQSNINAIFELRESGWTFSRIAENIGTTPQNAGVIYNHKKHRRA